MKNASLAKGLNVVNGQITYKAVAETHNLSYTPLEQAI
ncbi:hypothetical protein [Thermanaerosceptrum fracticalcis]